MAIDSSHYFFPILFYARCQRSRFQFTAPSEFYLEGIIGYFLRHKQIWQEIDANFESEVGRNVKFSDVEMLHELLIALNGYPGSVFILTEKKQFQVSKV